MATSVDLTTVLATQSGESEIIVITSIIEGLSTVSTTRTGAGREIDAVPLPTHIQLPTVVISTSNFIETVYTISSDSPASVIVVSSSNLSSETASLSSQRLSSSSTHSTFSQIPSSLPGSGSSLGAGAGAGIAIAVAFLLLAAVGGGLIWRKRTRRLQAAARAESPQTDKPQLDNTSVVPQPLRYQTETAAFRDRQELEGSPAQQTPTNNPAELRAGPYSNRHELENRSKYNEHLLRDC